MGAMAEVIKMGCMSVDFEGYDFVVFVLFAGVLECSFVFEF